MELFKTRQYKWAEMILVFIGIPLIYYFNLIPFHKSIPLLAVFFLFLFLLIRDKSFSSRIFGWNKFAGWKYLLVRFIAFVMISALAVFIFSKEFLFILPREQINLWLLIMVFYPVWSAYPQELIYRGWFFHRYRGLVKREWLFIGLNAALFAFSHIIFENWLAIALSFFGGIMFAMTYKKSKSLLVVFVEHMLYGNWIFTVGIGQYFYAPTGGY
jgi:membrane protease YdiL (CAAX protease family)